MANGNGSGLTAVSGGMRLVLTVLTIAAMLGGMVSSYAMLKQSQSVTAARVERLEERKLDKEIFEICLKDMSRRLDDIKASLVRMEAKLESRKGE